MDRRLRRLLLGYSGQTHRDLVFAASIHCSEETPLESIEGVNRSVVAAARYMRQGIREIEAFSVPELREFLRLTSELIAAENGSSTPRSKPGELAPAKVEPVGRSRGMAFVRDEASR